MRRAAARPGSSSPASPASVRASSTTRLPVAAAASARSWISPESPSTRTSGAPSTHVPSGPKDAALHLRTEENGATSPADQSSGLSANRSPIAASVAFGCGSAAASEASAASCGSDRSRTSTPSTTRRPSVSVPVLSMHSTSMRARPSTAGSSWTNTRRLARRRTPTANARLVSSTSPSGTMATVPATEAESASRTLSWLRSWLMNSSVAVGTIANVTTVRIVSIAARSSEWVSVNRRASSASDTA